MQERLADRPTRRCGWGGGPTIFSGLQIESGKPVNLTKISRESGIALSTLRQFYGVLEDTLVGFSVPAFSRSGAARVLKTPRFFIFDTGVRNALAGLPLDPRILATEGGEPLRAVGGV